MNKPLPLAILCGLGIVSLIMTARGLPAPPAAQAQLSPEEKGQQHAEENTGGRRRWQRERAGGPWSAAYLRTLFAIGQEQRTIFLRKLRITASTLRGSLLRGLPAARPAPPEPMWFNLGPTDGGSAVNAHYPDGGEFTKKIPSTDSGRVSQILADPRATGTLYVAAAEGGLWKTVDSGQHWLSLTEIDSVPSLAVGAVALDATTDTLYLGLGDIEEQAFGGTGTGILTSPDGGTTWSKEPKILGDSRAVASIFLHPDKTGVVLVGTDKGLFRSDDAGKSYLPVQLPDLDPDATTVRDIHWISGSQLLLTVGRNGTEEFGGGADILVSPDDGKSWKHAAGLADRSSISRISLAVAPRDHSVVYALASDDAGFFLDIFKSGDGGKTWAPLGAAGVPYQNPLPERQSPDSLFGVRCQGCNRQGTYDQLAIVDPHNPDIAYFGGNLNLIKTEDGGRSYRLISDWRAQGDLPYVHPDFHAATFDGRGNLWIANDGGLARSGDNGGHWSTAENQRLTTHLVYSISEGASGLLAGGFQDNGTRVSATGGSIFPELLMADGFDVLAHPRHPGELLASIYNTQIFRSENGGVRMDGSFQDIDGAGNDETAPFFTRIVPSPGDISGNTVLTFVKRKVYQTTDFAKKWTALPGRGLSASMEILNLNVAAKDPRTMALIVTEGGMERVLLSNDGGSSWHPAQDLPKSQGKLSSISFSPVDSRVLYVSSRVPDKDAPHLWISRDSGRSWGPIDKRSFPTGASVNVVIGDPKNANTLYAGTHFGLYRSRDHGEHWDRLGAQLPFVSVTDVHISPDARRIRIATFGRGIWELNLSAPR